MNKTYTVTKEHFHKSYSTCRANYNQEMGECKDIFSNCLIAEATGLEIGMSRKKNYVVFDTNPHLKLDATGQKLAGMFDDLIFGFNGVTVEDILSLLPAEVGLEKA